MEGFVLALCRELVSRRHELFLLYDTPGSMLPTYECFCKDVIQTRLVGFRRRSPIETWNGIASIGHILRKRGIDVVVSSHLGFLPVQALVRRLYGVPSLFHLGLPAPSRSRFRKWTYSIIGFGIAPAAHTMETWLHAGWPRQTFDVIPNWVDTEAFRPVVDRATARASLDIPADAACIVFVGRMTPEKGVEVLLRAFSLVLADMPNAMLIMVGAMNEAYGPRWNQLLQGLEPSTRERVIVRPVTTKPQDYFAAADVVSIPSIWQEPFPLVALEAMACAVPVIVSDVGILADLVGDANLVSKPGDVDMLGKRLHWWLTRPEASDEKGRQLREIAVERYGPKRSVDRYEEHLEKLAAARHSGKTQE